jgi:hypothetical protein
MEKTLRIAELILAIAGVCLFSLSWVMNLWMWQAMPTHLDLANGFVTPMILNGRMIYVPQIYALIQVWLFWAGLALFLCAAIIDVYKDPFRRRS